MNSAIIVAAGNSTRMNSGESGGSGGNDNNNDTPKQFRLLAGKPLIIHTLRAFEDAESIKQIIVVVAENRRTDFLQLVSTHGLRKLKSIVAGGASRTESVWRGLQNVRSVTAQIVAVHDGARPFVTAQEIDATVAAAEQSGAAILAVPAIDTIKRIDENGDVVTTLPRAEIYHAQTPQCFRFALLKQAYEQALKDLPHRAATDDSELVERLGVKVKVIEGTRRNIKITHAEDWWLAEKIIKTGG